MHAAAPVTHARLFGIAVPTMVANLTTPLLGIVGTAVIGRLGQAHLIGAVAISALVFDLIFWVFGFLRMGTVALTAQAPAMRRSNGPCSSAPLWWRPRSALPFSLCNCRWRS
jgi:Na+-driven multidrug efflux pump